MNPELLKRLAAVDMPAEALREVLGIIAECADSSARRSARSERNRRYYEKRSADVDSGPQASESVLIKTHEASECASESVLIKTPPSPPSSPPPLSPTPPIPAPTPAPTPPRNSAHAASAEAIYQAYPRKVGRPLALRAISKALASPPLGTESATWPALLLEITVRFAAARQGENPDFTPNPATWFNQRRFEDDPATWKTAPSPAPRYGQPTEAERRAAVLGETQRIRNLPPPPKPVSPEDRVTIEDFKRARHCLAASEAPKNQMGEAAAEYVRRGGCSDSKKLSDRL